jgi:hypothetical protein
MLCRIPDFGKIDTTSCEVNLIFRNTKFSRKNPSKHRGKEVAAIGFFPEDCEQLLNAMNISSASSASAQAIAAMERSRVSSTAAEARRSAEQATAAQVQTKRAVQQAAAAPREENRISPDIRQITAREVRRESGENRSENVRRIGEQMAAKFREVARRSEGVRANGNSERESFSAVA